MAKRVVVRGGGNNLFKISGSRTYEVYQVKVNLITNSLISIGSASSLEDALSIIRSYSGEEIKEIREW